MTDERVREAVREFFLDLSEGKHGREVRRLGVKAAMRDLSPGRTSETDADLFDKERRMEKALLRRRRKLAVKESRRRKGHAGVIDANERMQKMWATRRARYGVSGRGRESMPLGRIGQRTDLHP